jgi:hypothetical protein
MPPGVTRGLKVLAFCIGLIPMLSACFKADSLGGNCNVREDCDSGQFCVDNVCSAMADTMGSDGSETAEESGTAETGDACGMGPTDGSLYSPCDNNDDCIESWGCVGLVGAQYCGRNCDDASHCGNSFGCEAQVECNPDPNLPWGCAMTCTGNVQCPEGMACMFFSGNEWCMPVP